MSSDQEALIAELRELRQLGAYDAVEQRVRRHHLISSPAVLELIQSRVLRGHLSAAADLCDQVITKDADSEWVAEARLQRALLTIHLDGRFGDCEKVAQQIAAAAAPEQRYIRAQAERVLCQIVAMRKAYRLASDESLRAACVRVATVARTFEEVREHDHALIAWLNLGHYPQLLTVPERTAARTALETAAEKARSWQLPAREAEALMNLAELLYTEPSSRAESLRLFEEARRLFGRIDHHHGAWDVERLLAKQRLRLGEDATTELDRCRQAYVEQEHLRWLQDVLTTLATWSLRCGRMRPTRLYSEEATRVSRRMGSVPAEIQGRMTMADFHARSGEYSKAIQEYQAQLASDPPLFLAIQIRTLLANAFLATGNEEEAGQQYREIGKISLEDDDIASGSLAAMNLANTYMAAREFARARQVLTEWIPRDEARGAWSDVAQKYSLFGDLEIYAVSRVETEPEEGWSAAARHFSSALSVTDRMDGTDAQASVAKIHQSLANLELSRGRSDRALGHIDQAMALYSGLDYETHRANSTLMKGLVHYQLAVNQGKLSSFHEAMTAFEAALQFYQESEIHDQAQQARYLLAQLCSRATVHTTSEKDRAKLLERSRCLLEEYEEADRKARWSLVLRDPVVQQTARLNLRRKEDVYRFAIDVSTTYGKDPARALHWLERQKSRVFLEALALTPLQQPGDEFFTAFAEQEKSLLARIRRAESDRDAFVLSLELDALYQVAEKRSGPTEYLHLRRGQPLAASQIRELVAADPPMNEEKPRRQILVHYYVREDDTQLFISCPEEERPGHVSVRVARAALARFAKMAFASRLGHKAAFDETAPAHLHQLDELVRPLIDYASPGDVVTLVPYGELHLLPLHALRIEGEPLVARNPVCYTPSATVLKYCRSKRKIDASGRPRLVTAAVFGDPTEDVPPNRECARRVAALFGSRLVLGSEATVAAFEKAARGVDVIHFQGHATFDFEEPLSARLYLANGETLTARQIFGLDGIEANLVSLGACQTGFQQVRAGDELLGLVRALMYAGTPSVLATLWPVHQDSTVFFMERFYTHLREVPKVDAVRAAMLETRAERPEWNNVYHWAPFSLIGDWY